MTDPESDYYIPDSRIQASSSHDIYGITYAATEGRLNNTKYNSCWLPGGTDTSPWIQGDIGVLVSVYGVQTKGYVLWVTTLKVSTFQGVPVAGESGAFIQEDGQDAVCTIS